MWRLLLRIAVPVALQTLLTNLLPLLDTFMLGFLGAKEIAAATLANTPFFVLSVAIAGFQSGNNVLAAQYFGKRDMTSINRVFGMTLAGCLSLSALFCSVLFFFPVQVFSLLSKDAEVVLLAADYAKYMAFAAVISAVGNTYVTTLRCVEKAAFGLFVQVFSVVLNGLLNILFIYGAFGLFPPMGVAGAALGTLITRCVELAMIAFYAFFMENVFVLQLKSMFSFHKTLFKDYVKNCAPIVLNECLWGLGSALITVVYSLMGTEVLAANAVAVHVERLGQVLSFGFMAASSVIVGQLVGAGKTEEGYQMAGKLNTLSFLVGAAMGCLLAVTGYFALPFFKLEGDAARMALLMVLVYAAAVPLKSFNVVNLVGSLRAGGDGLFVAVLDVFFLLSMAVPLAFLFGVRLSLPVLFVAVLQPCEELIKLVIGSLRYRSKKWMRNLTRPL